MGHNIRRLVLIMGHNIHFKGVLWKIIPKLSLLLILIWSAEIVKNKTNKMFMAFFSSKKQYENCILNLAFF